MPLYQINFPIMFDWYRNRRTCFDKFTRWFSFVSTFFYFIRLLFFKLNSSAWIFSSRIFYSHITKQWNFFLRKWFHFSSISLNTFVHFNRRELLIYTFKQFAQGFHVFAHELRDAYIWRWFNGFNRFCNFSFTRFHFRLNRTYALYNLRKMSVWSYFHFPFVQYASIHLRLCNLIWPGNSTSSNTISQ